MFLGLCRMSFRETLFATLHISEEEPEEEDHGVLLILHVCKVSL